MFVQSEHCPEDPSTMAAMRGCYRPLLVFSPAADDPRLAHQLAELRPHVAELLERNILVVVDVHIHGTNSRQLPSELLSSVPTATLGDTEQEQLRDRYKIGSNDFIVLLVGKDGSEKQRKQNFYAASELENAIDAMPMRRDEEKQ